MMANDRTLVFVIHGGTFSQLIENTKKRNMKNLKVLMDQGSYCIAKSVFSTSSAVDYTSMFTGCTHEKHGIYHAFLKNKGKARPCTSYDVKLPYIWNMFDFTSLVIGLFSQATFPALPMPDGGVQISGHYGIGNSYLLRDLPTACNNPNLWQELIEKFPNYSLVYPLTSPPLYPKGAKNFKDFFKTSFKDSIKHYKQDMEAKLWISKKVDWRLAIIESAYNDTWQHNYWPRPKNHPLFNEIDAYLHKKGFLERTWKITDKFLGHFLEDGMNVIVVSDHGLEAVNKRILIHEKILSILKVHKIFFKLPGWELKNKSPSWQPERRAEHTYDGFFCATGQAFKRLGRMKQEISVMDMAPLLLKLHGKEIPKHMDGFSPEIFSEAYSK